MTHLLTHTQFDNVPTLPDAMTPVGDYDDVFFDAFELANKSLQLVSISSAIHRFKTRRGCLWPIQSRPILFGVLENR